MTQDDFDKEIEKFIVNYAGDFAPTDFAPSYAAVAAKARDLMICEIEEANVMLNAMAYEIQKLRADLALAVEALRKYTELQFQLQIPKGEGETLITAINEEFCKVEIFANQTLTKLGSDKCLCSETNARNCPVHQNEGDK